MGVGELRESFNAVASPIYVAQMAFLHYTRAHDTEWQVVTIRGTDDAGATFEAVSDPLPPHTDLNQAAKELAQAMIDQRNPAP